MSPIDTRPEHLIVANNLLVPYNLWIWWTVSRVKYTNEWLLIYKITRFVCFIYKLLDNKVDIQGVLSLGYLNQDICFLSFFFNILSTRNFTLSVLTLHFSYLLEKWKKSGFIYHLNNGYLKKKIDILFFYEAIFHIFDKVWMNFCFVCQ